MKVNNEKREKELIKIQSKRADIAKKMAKNLKKQEKLEKRLKILKMSPNERKQERLDVANRRKLIAGSIIIKMIRQKSDFDINVFADKLLSKISDSDGQQYFKSLLKEYLQYKKGKEITHER